jgi:hypothetical protein
MNVRIDKGNRNGLEQIMYIYYGDKEYYWIENNVLPSSLLVYPCSFLPPGFKA